MNKKQRTLGIIYLLLIITVVASLLGCIWLDFYLSLKVLLSSIVLMVVVNVIYKMVTPKFEDITEPTPKRKTFKERLEEIQNKNK